MSASDRKTPRPEAQGVIEALDRCKSLTKSKQLQPALAALRAAFAGLVESERMNRGGRSSLTAFRTSLVSGLLFQCWQSNDSAVLDDAKSTVRELYDTMMNPGHDADSSSTFQLPFDERIATLSLRVLQKAGLPRGELLARLRGSLGSLGSLSGANSPKRRLFAPLLDGCEASGDPGLALDLLREARTRGIALRDVDFEKSLRAVANDTAGSTASRSGHVVSILRLASETQPLVGGRCSELILSLLPGSSATFGKGPAASGACAVCKGEFSSHGFTETERIEFLNRIVDNLVKPFVAKRAAANPDDSTVAQALPRFLEFKAKVDSMPRIGAVVDGANVGFFGLSSWYEDAKRASLKESGHDTRPGEQMTTNELKKAGIATDVPPNFTIIGSAVDAFLSEDYGAGALPAVFLHERHLAASSLDSDNGRNRAVMERWKHQGIPVIITPSHINDDLCWMYAAVKHSCAVISNDQMRDHHFGLLAPESFLKWRVTHQFKYSCRFPPMTQSGVTVSLRKPPPCVSGISVRGGTDRSPNASGVPGGIHLPFTKRALLEETGKLLPGTSVPEGTLLLPESRAELIENVPRWIDGWICAPFPSP